MQNIDNQELIMTYEEEIAAQKRKFFALAKRLDGFWNGFSGPDPKWDVLYPLRSAKGKWGRCYACRYKTTTGFGFANGLRATVDTGENTFDMDMSHIWFNRRAALDSSSSLFVMCYGDERKWNPTISDCKNCPPI